MALAGQVCGFHVPNVSLMGVGTSKEAGSPAKALGATKALIVTDKGLAQLGVAAKNKAQLEEAGVMALCLLVVLAATYFASLSIAMAAMP